MYDEVRCYTHSIRGKIEQFATHHSDNHQSATTMLACMERAKPLPHKRVNEATNYASTIH